MEQQTSQIEAALNQALGRQTARTIVMDSVGTVADWWILADATNAPIIFTLPPSSVGLRAIGVKKIDGSGNTVTVVPSGQNTIDGGASQVIGAQYGAYIFVPDGTNSWWIMGKN